MAKLRLNGREYELVAEKITLGQIETLQEITQTTALNELLPRAKAGDLKAVIAVIWLGMNCTDPEVTPADVRAIVIESMEVVGDEKEGEVEGDPPTVAAPSSRDGSGESETPLEPATTGVQ